MPSILHPLRLFLRPGLAALLAVILSALSPARAAEEAPADDHGAEASAEGGDGHGKPKPGADEAYVTLDQIVLPVFDQGHVGLMVRFDLAIQVRSYDDLTEARALEPRLRDAVFSRLYGALEVGTSVKPNGLIDLDQVRRAAQRASISVLGKDKVVTVLIQKLDQARAF